MGWSDTCGKSRTLVAPDLRVMFSAAFLAAACFLLSSPAQAQLCSSGSGGEGNLSCDMRYFDTKVECRSPYKGGEETVGTQPPCPKDPMPMKQTELKSFIADFSPYLFAYARDKDDKNKPYAGTYYRGTPGDTTLTFQMIGGEDEEGEEDTDQPGKYKRHAPCVNQVQLDGGSSVEDQAKIVRLQLDNCANQYILNAALGQGSEKDKQDPTLLSMENPEDPGERISLKTQCQPLKTKTDPEQEYSASHYLEEAWKKLLQNPSQHDAKRPKEPYIEGLNLKSQIPYPSDAPRVTLSDIAKVDYEEINDPSHPYTPRWDFENNERDEYSPKTKDYSEDTKNSVFCAGERDGDKKKMMKVDILAFRKKPFDTGIMHRIDFNKACFEDDNRNTGTIPEIAASSYCYEVISYYPPPGEAQAHPCWECFGNTEGQKADYEQTFAPCSTGHSIEDLSIEQYFPGAYNGMQREAACNNPPKRNPEEEIEKLCKQLRKPFTPINKLKMRYHNPEDDPDNDVLYEGVPEGLTFKEYFEDHMPYPRLWDVGQSIQKTATTDATRQDPHDNLGQWTAIVGIGREGAPKGSSSSSSGGSSSSSSGGEEEEEHKDERCLFGGWGGDVSFAGVNIPKPNPITSWTELKLAQTRILRDQHISCLPRYEKTYKPGSSEALALLVTGANWNSSYISCRKEDGTTEYHRIGEEGADCGSGGESTKKGYELKQEGHTNAWRGYISAKEESNRFPKLGGGSGPQYTGLDNAECSDIIVMEKGATEGGKPGLPKLGVIVAVNIPNKSSCNAEKPSNCAARKNCYVDVIEYDNGKWPDTCGTTDSVNEKKTRRMWKPGMLPKNVETELKGLNWITSCEDTKIASCEMKAWNSVKLYRISEDEREGNSGEEDSK